MDDTCVWHEGTDNLKAHVTGYFANLFTSEVLVPDPVVLSHVKKSVTIEMNEALLKPYTTEEVRKALFDIGDLKAPGPDGLYSIFYKRFWPMLGDDLVTEVLAVVNTRIISEGWNDTTIVMIPKVKKSGESYTIQTYQPV